MPILLPIAVFLLLFRVLLHRGDSTREAILRAAVLSVTILVTMTELLSAFYLVTRGAMIASWSVVLIAITALLLRSLKRIAPPPRPPSQRAIHLPGGLRRLDLALSIAIVFVLAIIGIIAVIAPPNAADAMEYHLPRMIFWVSNHTVRNYPTPDYSQLMEGPAADFVALHSYLLFGSDRLVNLVGLLSLSGCAVAVSLIAGKFSTGRTGQLFAGIFVVTLPEAVLGSSEVTTTVAVSFWIVTACYFAIQAIKAGRTFDIVTAAFATGLALLTNGSAVIYIPLLLFGCLRYEPAARRSWILKRIPLLLFIALALNVPQFLRVWQVTGTPFGGAYGAAWRSLYLANERPSPVPHGASDDSHAIVQAETTSDATDNRIVRLARQAIHVAAVDAEDLGALFWPLHKTYAEFSSRGETQAGNPLHLLLLIVGFAALPFVASGMEDPGRRSILWYATGLFGNFFVLLTALRLQPASGHLQLSLFIAAAVIVGHIAGRIHKRRLLLAVVSILLILDVLPYVLANPIRSVLPIKNFATIYEPRSDLYFADQHAALAPEYIAVAAAIKRSKCDNIALDTYLPLPGMQIAGRPSSVYIYPLLAQLHIDGHLRTAHYIDVHNFTERFAATPPQARACAIVCLGCAHHESIAAAGSTQVFGDSEVTLAKTLP